jgi:hypothetical protein
MLRRLATIPFKDIDKSQLFRKTLAQATLHLQHNVRDCQTKKDSCHCHLFDIGLEQGIKGAMSYIEDLASDHSQSQTSLAQALNRLQTEMLETCDLAPYQAAKKWGLTELADKLDIEKEDIICGVRHGIQAFTLTLPQHIKEIQNESSPRLARRALKRKLLTN